MYGRWEGELWFHRRHMWPVPSPCTPSLVASINSSVFIDSNTFSKGGRKIHVGDCALFKPPHESPPFIGIICRLIVDKEDNLSLSVNWLYRPADVKLLKGASPEAAPNEVFYSFHQDETPAASLLHPCKVAFLRKGVELPSRISSFVCRRVYDVETKRLWWLTDQDYINDRQEVVDQLLNKTRVEMYGALQAGGHSPKPLNGGQNGTTQLKSSTEVKGKIREHIVHSSDSVKRERLSKPDDQDSVQLGPEDILKAEIAKITDKGGLVDFEGVEKLIQLMQPENSEKKVDIASRIMLVNVISVTERSDCLNRFVQLRGLLVLDEWLQEFHKGKIGDGGPKEIDKSVEEFLFALLRALDKLPVNLHALQTCNVGKSVNHLRSHKNPEILKKAKSLVDTWKKRVEVEMNMIERKRVEQMNIIETRSGTRRGGSWPTKSLMSEVGAKISASQPSVLKKHNSGEAIVKSPESSSPTKPPAPVPVPAGAGSSDVPPIKEEKTGSCSPSAKNTQSCSGEQVKTGTCCKEDAHSPKKSSTCAVRGVQKEGDVVKISKGSPEQATDESLADNINNNQRLIVRLPNTRTVSGGSLEDQLDGRETGKWVASPPPDNNVVAVNTDSCQGKEFLASDDVEHVQDGENGGTQKSGKSNEASYSSANTLVESSSEVNASINALVERCAKISEGYDSINALADSCLDVSKVNVSARSGGDDVGMNLLASVASGEISRSDVSPAGSPENKPRLPEDTSSHDLKVTNGHVQLTPVDSLAGRLPENGNADSRSPSEEDKKALSSSNIENEKKSESCDVGSEQKDEKSEDRNLDSDSCVLQKTNENLDKNMKEETEKSEESGPVKLDFDLNEVVPSDDGIKPDVERPSGITVAAAARGPFLKSENLLKGKAELGWKGSAATSAFRPAEPRKPAHAFLDFDLNVGVVDDVNTQNNVPSKYPDSIGGGGLDLNLNENPDFGFPRPTTIPPPRAHLSGRFSNLESGFDLNGPGMEENSESIPLSINGIHFMPNVTNGRMSNNNMSSWFPPSSYPIPSQRMLTPVPSGPVLSSSPAFQFPGFPFDTNFSVGSSGGPDPGPLCFPPQLGLVSAPYRPYVMSLPNSSTSNRKWGSNGLDLNSGLVSEHRDETLRQIPLSDDQLKLFQHMAAGGGGSGLLKRKEPADGWDGDRISYKHHPSWQ